MGSLAYFNLASIRVMHGLHSLVETGTATGDGTEHARAAGFEVIHTIEIVPELAAAARARFRADHRVQVWDGDSRHCLPMILKELPPQPALFWLDAHFPGAHTGAAYDAEPDAARRLPLADEVALIRAARPEARDVLLIDDARLYEPSVQNCGTDEYAAAIYDGTWPPIAGMKRGFGFLRELYGATHNVVIDHRPQGIALVFPKLPQRKAA